MKTTRIGWLLGFGCAWCVAGFPQDNPGEKQLFESVFGQRKARANQRISVPLTLDQRELGLAELDLAATPLLVSVKTIVPLLKGILKPEALIAIEHEQKNGWINFDELSKLGLNINYSAQKIALDLKLDLALRLEKSIQIDQRRTQGIDEASLPIAKAQEHSLILNTRLIQSWQLSSTTPPVQRGRVFTDWAGRTGNWVTEMSGSFATDAMGGGFNRTDTRLVRDWSDQAIRLVVGDTLSAARGALGTQVMGGIRLTRQFSMNPKINNLSQASDKLSLSAGAAVDVDVNGFLVRTLRLDPGVYNLRDIHAFQGANDISIRVVEPGGRVVLKRFDYFFDSTLLAPGLSEWDLAWGAPSATTLTGRQYAGSSKAGAGWWRRGWSNAVTAGVGVQTSDGIGMKSRVIQFEGAMANQWGAWSGWLASSSREIASSAALNGRGVAQMLQWRAQTTQRPQREWTGNLTLQATHYGRQYSPVESTTASFASNDVGLRAGIAWGENWSASLAASRLISEDPTRSNRALTLGVRRRIDREWSAESTLGQSQNSTLTQNYFTIALRYSPIILNEGLDRSESPLSWRAGSSYQSIDRRWQNDVEVAGTNAALDAAWRVNGAHAQSQVGNETTFRSRIQTTRGESTWASIQTNDRLAGTSTGYHEWTLSNALVMTASGTRLSGPVYDSAVVFKPREGFESYKLLIDPQVDRAAAASDSWGTPVLSNVFSYSPREIQMDLENLPPAKSLGPDRWVLFPKYRSVLEIPVGSDANTQISGTLINSAGEPVALQSLRVIPQAQAVTSSAPIEMFTNRKGQFMTPSLPPGQYQIVRLADDTMLYRFEIAPQQSGVSAIGAVIVKE